MASFPNTRNVKHLFSLMPKLPIFQLDLDFFGELGYKKILADHENFTTLFWLLALGQSNMNGASKPSKKKVYLSSILLICMMMCEKAPLYCKKCPELLTNDLEEKTKDCAFFARWIQQIWCILHWLENAEKNCAFVIMTVNFFVPFTFPHFQV